MSNKGLSPVDLRDFYIIRTLSMRRIQCFNTWPWASPRSLDFRLYTPMVAPVVLEFPVIYAHGRARGPWVSAVLGFLWIKNYNPINIFNETNQHPVKLYVFRVKPCSIIGISESFFRLFWMFIMFAMFDLHTNYSKEDV